MQLTLSKWIPHPEGYRLTVNEQGIRIEGSTPQGVFYSLQTFRQLITTHQGQIRIPYVVIDDAQLLNGAHSCLMMEEPLRA